MGGWKVFLKGFLGWRDFGHGLINSLVIGFTRGVLFISRPLCSSSQRAQRKTNLFFEKSLRRRFFKRTHASGGVLFAERESSFDCRLPKVPTKAGSAVSIILKPLISHPSRTQNPSFWLFSKAPFFYLDYPEIIYIIIHIFIWRKLCGSRRIE